MNKLYDKLIGSMPEVNQIENGGKEGLIESVDIDAFEDVRNFTDEQKHALKELGFDKIRQGKVAVVILAGG